jgi:hypothetical protein
MTTEAQHRTVIDQFRQYYDETLCRHVGARPPTPFPGQTVSDYRVEALRSFKRTYLPQNHDLAKVNFRRERHNHRNDEAGFAELLAGLEPQVLAACLLEANNPLHVPKGQLKEIKRMDQTGHLRMIEFIGQESFVKQMTIPGRRVRINQNPTPNDAQQRWHGAHHAAG